MPLVDFCNSRPPLGIWTFLDSARARPEPVTGYSCEVFERHVDRVYYVLRLRGVPKVDRDDLAHDVFVRVQIHWEQCRTPEAPEKWITAIARNLAREYEQAGTRAGRVFDHDADVTRVAAPDGEPERHEAAQVDRVRQLLHEIRNATRREIVTRRIEGETNPTIAAALGIPLPTVVSHFKRGREELEAALARDDARKRHPSRLRGLAVVLPISSSRWRFDDLVSQYRAPESVRARLRARLQQSAQYGGGGGDDGGEGPSAPGLPPVSARVPVQRWAFSWGSALCGAAFTLALLALGVVLALWWDPRHGSHAAPVEPRAEVAAVVVPTAPPAPSATPAPNGDPVPSAAPVLPAAPPVTMAPGPSEHDLLDRAERAFARHDLPGALAALDKHARLFKGGRLAGWRESMRIDVLHADGQRHEAQARTASRAAVSPNVEQHGADR